MNFTKFLSSSIVLHGQLQHMCIQIIIYLFIYLFSKIRCWKMLTFLIIPKDSLFFTPKKNSFEKLFIFWKFNIYTNNRISVEAAKVPNTYFSIYSSNIVFLHLLYFTNILGQTIFLVHLFVPGSWPMGCFFS